MKRSQPFMPVFFFPMHTEVLLVAFDVLFLVLFVADLIFRRRSKA